MTRPLIVTTLPDGSTKEREMDDIEFAAYEAKAKEAEHDAEAIHARIEARITKLANP